MEHLLFSVPRDVDSDVMVEFCRKDACGQAAIAPAALQTSDPFHPEVSFEGPPTVEPLFVCVTTKGQTSAVCTVSWALTAPEQLAKGDTLSVRLTVAQQQPLSRSGAVDRIQNEYPNGEDCGVGCKSATVDLRD
jgi:hypothetical protein